MFCSSLRPIQALLSEVELLIRSFDQGTIIISYLFTPSQLPFYPLYSDPIETPDHCNYCFILLKEQSLEFFSVNPYGTLSCVLSIHVARRRAMTL